MAKIPSRGTILKTDIATVLTAVAQLNSINVNGIEVETFDGSTLDQTLPGKIMCPTGYVESGEIAIGGFMDPTVMAWLTDLIDNPIGTIGANAAGGRRRPARRSHRLRRAGLPRRWTRPVSGQAPDAAGNGPCRPPGQVRRLIGLLPAALTACLSKPVCCCGTLDRNFCSPSTSLLFSDT